jgi:hypothetical protein
MQIYGIFTCPKETENKFAVKYTRALIRLSAAAERKNLREQIEQAQPLTEREWLLSMLEERPRPTNAEAATR